MKLDLQCRDLRTGESGPRAFDSVDAARVWLRERPSCVEVLGIASHHVPPEVSQELKLAMRPLDDEERALAQALDAKTDAELERRARERMQQAAAEAARHREAQIHADPNRPMMLRYHHPDVIGVADPADPRTLTEEARAAVLEWVAERSEWVKGRGQIVAEATLEVYPGPVPAGKERVVTGRFIPVTAPTTNQA
jgi:hypothetical protein